MLEIKVDDHTFYLSRRTLIKFPNTKLYKMLLGDGFNSNFIEKRETYYIIDTDPDKFRLLVKLLRGYANFNDYSNDRLLNELCISLDIDIEYISFDVDIECIGKNVLHNSPLDHSPLDHSLLDHLSIEKENIEYKTNQLNNICFSDQLFDRSPDITRYRNKKTVIRSRKIELDTSEG